MLGLTGEFNELIMFLVPPLVECGCKTSEGVGAEVILLLEQGPGLDPRHHQQQEQPVHPEQ